MAQWNFETTFPLIARLIDRVHAETGAPATRDQLREALLRDPAAQVGAIAEKQNRKAPDVAGNMVDWWSAEQTQGTNPYAADYTRLTIDGKAAYLPRLSGAVQREATEEPASPIAQGRLLDPARRQAVEKRAMDDARAWLETLGWAPDEITDTSVRNPYDLLAERPGERLFVEVKGISGTEPTVMVTEGEVRHATAHPDECALFVLTGIDGAEGLGETRHVFMPWRPREGSLIPISYRHLPLGSGRRG
ncbi:MAG: protein NO VEIN domain-containing protein [Acidimicrobiales bacterium]